MSLALKQRLADRLVPAVRQEIFEAAAKSGVGVWERMSRQCGTCSAHGVRRRKRKQLDVVGRRRCGNAIPSRMQNL